MLAEGGKTGPIPTDLVTPHGSAIPIEAVQGRLATFRASVCPTVPHTDDSNISLQVMSREAQRCAISGAMDIRVADKLLQNNPDMDSEQIGDTTYCEAAHVLPHGIGQAKANGSLVSGAQPTLHINAYPY